MSQKTVKRPRKIRSPDSGTKIVRKAVDLAAFQKKVMRGYDRAAGRLKRFGEQTP